MALHKILLLTMLSAMEMTTSLSASPSKASRSYKVVKANATCSAEEVKIRLELNKNFHGVVYAKGFPIEKDCRSLGTDEKFVEITLSTSGCGVRLVPQDDQTLMYTVSLNVQMDKFLQQINDLEVTSSCSLTPQDMVRPRLSSRSKQSSRTGRKEAVSITAAKEMESLNQIKSWMEIEGTSQSPNVNRVSVGEQTLVLVKTLLPVAMSARVVDCLAHDGTGEATQKLLDENGCPLDESIMSSLEPIKDEDEGTGNEIMWEAGEDSPTTTTMRTKGKTKKPKATDEKEKSIDVQLVPERFDKVSEEKTMLRVIGTIFSAFKFPDTANLHLKCVLQICRDMCPTINCGRNSTADDLPDRMGKSLKLLRNGEIVDKIEVFNSVEVVAPGIDTDGLTSDDADEGPKSTSGEQTFCLSASKMAFSFAILGAIFLCGVLAALWTVMRNHGRKMSKSFDGSEQILVVRDSPMNFGSPRSKPLNSWSYT